MSTTKRIARTAVESLALSVVRSGLATAAQRTGSSLLVMAQNTLDCIEDGDLDGARIELVLTDLRPNRPTFQQMADRPGLDGFRSQSIGGAAIEGQITTADGRTLPVRYDWFSSSLADVHGIDTWSDADRAYRRLAVNLADGRYVTR